MNDINSSKNIYYKNMLNNQKDQKDNNYNIISNTEELYYNKPYNDHNIEITEKNVKNILNTHGVPNTIHNINLYKRAFVHTSYVKKIYDNLTDKPINVIDLKSKSNERLEFLGDGILDAITKYYLYKRFPKENEGFMTEKKIAIVKNETIGKFAYKMGLNKWFLISDHCEEKGMRTNVKKLGCLFEAFIGSIFLDFNKVPIKDEDNYFNNLFLTGPGFQICQLFLENIFEKYIDWTELLLVNDNYKNILQVMIQKRFKITPDYVQLNDDKECYIMGVFICFNEYINNFNIKSAKHINDFNSIEEVSQLVMDNETPLLIKLGDATHKIKKKSEQFASNEAINNINNISD